jgi:hypothetical protein
LTRRIATENIYAEDEQGIRRLVVGVGMEIPEGVDVPESGSADAADLPIANYDQLEEGEIVEQLGDLSDEDLGKVRAYEQAKQARGSITTYGVESKPVTAGRRGAAAAAEPAEDAELETGDGDGESPSEDAGDKTAAKPAARKRSRK